MASLKGPVLGHFGLLDKVSNATPKNARAFAAEMNNAGKQVTMYFYDADHAFARIQGATYDEAANELSWRRSLDFLKENLAK